MQRSKHMVKRSKIESKRGNEIWLWVGVIAVIIIIVCIAVMCNNSNDSTKSPTSAPKEGFLNSILGKIGKTGNNDIRSLDVLFFMSPSCPWCQKMKAVFEKEKKLGDVTVVDVTKPEGVELAKQYGSIDKGVPSFVSKKLKTGTVGFKESVSELVQALKQTAQNVENTKSQAPQMNPQEANSKIQDLGIIMFMSPSCGYCTKAKEMLDSAGVLGAIELVDISQENGKALVQQHIPEFRGVPAFKSKTTGKISVGFKPLDSLVQELS